MRATKSGHTAPAPTRGGGHPLAHLAAPAALALAVVLWSLLVLFSLLMQRAQLDRTAQELARIDAVANLRKDMAIRKWASTVGGVFINESRAPNIDALSEQERLTAETGTGDTLKLISLTPIHILLGIQEVSNKEYGRKERLTSLQLYNRANAPDEWESSALKDLEAGAKMVTEATPPKGGHGLMRVMIPMRMEEECLECHRETLIPVGGLRGGASIALDLNTYRTAQEPAWRTIQYWHAGIWLFGLASLSGYWNFLRRRSVEHAREEVRRRENEAAFAAMAEGALIADENANIVWVNDAFCSIYGYAREDVIGRNPRILKSGRHGAEFYRAMWDKLAATGHWRGEVWNRRKNGDVFPEELSIQALRDANGKTTRFISIFSDITERRRADEELRASRSRLQELAAFLETVREAERQRIARELHDELGQSLTALRIDLNWIRAKCVGDNPAANERVRGALDTVEHTVDAVRRISEDLRPRMLDDLGLAAALEHHVEQFARRSAIPCTLHMDRDDYEVDERTATAVFRAVQEALTNVARHSGANQVEVDLVGDEDTLHVEIRDNGRGIAGDGGGKTFGLLGMRERIGMLGGTIDIVSAPGGGTAVRIAVPLGTTAKGAVTT